MPFVQIHDTSILQRVLFEPKHEPSSDAAKALVPKFLYEDPSDTSLPEIKERMYGERRRLRIVVVGAGLTGLAFLHYLSTTIPEDSFDLAVYERNEDVGGTWLTTRYPGVRSDIPGPSYQFTWRPHVWTQFYQPGEETCEYLQTVARENDFYRFMHFKHEVVGAAWSDDTAKWTLTLKNLATGECFHDNTDLFVELTGPVSNPKLTVPGIEQFQGEVVHSGAWRDDLDLKGKRVALLGYGSSGVQIVPNIINDVSKLYTWFRSKLFLNPPFYGEYSAAEGANFRYTTEQTALLQDPDVYLAYRKEMDDSSNSRWQMMLNGNPMSGQIKEMVESYMRKKLAPKPGLADAIMPQDFDMGCRRPTLCHGYLEALADPKTTVFLEEPKHFTPKGFLDSSGTEHQVDLIIAATGYDQENKPLYPKSVNGEDMGTKWSKDLHPRSYMAVCLEGMPNYFHSGAAYAPVYRSWYQVAEASTQYMVKMIDKMQLEHMVSFRPTPKAVDHFTRHSNAFMQRMVQSGPCSSWYKGRDGRPRMWPGNHGHYMRCYQHLRGEDFEWRYEDEDDVFSWMGNGFCWDSDGKGQDSTWYIPKPEREVSKEEIEKLLGVHGVAMPPPNIKKEKVELDEAARL